MLGVLAGLPSLDVHAALPLADEELAPPPGSVSTSWVGNSFGGDGGGNGFGYWVQNGVDEIEVTPDGTVIAGVAWDEAGRCVGLYKDGKVNRVLVRSPEGTRETAWGWNTGNNAIAVDGPTIYIANTGKRLLRFAWTPGNLDSARYVDEVGTDAEAVGLAAGNGSVIVAYKDAVEVRKAGDLSVDRKFSVPELADVAVAHDGSVWVIAARAVRHFSIDGREVGKPVPESTDRPPWLSTTAIPPTSSSATTVPASRCSSST